MNLNRSKNVVSSFALRWMFVSCAASLGSTLATVPSLVDAGIYQFADVVDTTSIAPNGSTFFSNTFNSDYISVSGGKVAFEGFYPGGQAILTGSGGPLTVVAKTGDSSAIGAFTTLVGAAISGNNVAFDASSNSTKGIFRSDGTTLTTIAKLGDSAPTGSFSNFDFPRPVISGGTVLFSGAFNNGNAHGVFTGSGGSLTTIAKTGGSTPNGNIFSANGFDGISIGGNTVAFRGAYNSGGFGLYSSTGGVLTKIVQTGDAAPAGSYTGLGGRSAVGGNAVATGVLFNNSNAEGYVVGSGGTLTFIAKTGDPAPIGTFAFGDLDSYPAYNGNLVEFSARYNGAAADAAIFTGNGGPLSTLIKSGDPLFGSTVSFVRSGELSLDAGGDIAFVFGLSNGRSGIAIATPVPEPATIVLGGIGLLMFVARFRTRFRRSVST